MSYAPTTTSRDTRADDVVITGAGAVTAAGVGIAAQLSYAAAAVRLEWTASPSRALTAFKAAPHVKDKRLLKAISHPDGIGLAAIQALVADFALSPGTYAPERTGLYVGATAASAFDNEPYMDAMAASEVDGGGYSLARFGEKGMSARPTTLLLGLPNNVLCYGSLMLDARGPNSNYTSIWMSSLMAMHQGTRALRRNRADLVIAGGFSVHSDPVGLRVCENLGFRRRADARDGGVVADGAAFLSLERRGAASARGARILGTVLGSGLASDGLGPMRFDPEGRALEGLIRSTLSRAGRTVADLGLVMADQCGLTALGAVERAVLARCLGEHGPAFAATSQVFGNLLEGAGPLETALALDLLAKGHVPEALLLDGLSGQVPLGRKLALVLRVSPWGEYGAVLVEGGAP